MGEVRPLRVWRELRHLSQEQLAAAVGVSQAMISHIEIGKHSPRVEIAQRIAQTLGVATDDIAWRKVNDTHSDTSSIHED